MPKIGQTAVNPQTGERIVLTENGWQPAEKEPGKALGAIRALLGGATFGFADELAHLAAAVPASIVTGDPYWDVYRTMQQEYAKEQERFRQAHPATALGAEIGGGLLTGGVGATRAMAAPAMQALPRFAQYGALGAGTGGLAGAGFAQEGERLRGAATGAALGGGLGAVAQPIAGAVGGVARRAIQALPQRPSTQAKRMLLQAIERDELTPRRVGAAVRALGPEATIADAAGENVIGLARAATAVSGPAKQAAAKALRQRAKGQRKRISSAIKSALGTSGEDFYTKAASLEDEMRAAAKPLYNQAHAVEIPDTDTLRGLLGRIPESAQRKAFQLSKMRGDDISKYIAQDKEGVIKAVKFPNMRTWDYIKQALDDDYSVAMRAGNTQLAGATQQIKRELLDELDNLNPAYRLAREAYAGPASNKAALEAGRQALRQDAELTEQAINMLSQSEKEMFRIGAARAVSDLVRRGGQERSVISRFDDMLIQDRLSPLFESQKDFRAFRGMINKEMRLAYTKGKVLGGSPTTRIAEEVADLQTPIGTATDIIRGDYLGAAANLARQATGPRAVPQQVNEELAKMLFTPGFRQTWPMLQTLGQPAAPYISPMVGPAAMTALGEQAGIIGQ